MFEARNICKSYHGVQVLSSVSFVLQQGECMGISGANGAGKSTLLRILAQLQRPDAGELLFHGKSVLGSRTFLRKALGFVPQETVLAPELTVRQQLALWRAACGWKNSFPEDVCEILGLNALMDRTIQELSGGMQKRVSIAMALGGSPQLLIFDEATAGLDSAYSAALLQWLHGFLHRGGMLIWCSHHRDELADLCSCCYHLQDGIFSPGMAEP